MRCLEHRPSVILFVVGNLLLSDLHSTPPDPPVIVEPADAGHALSPADVHMVTEAFSDPDGDAHHCSDWEIWKNDPEERVWAALCIGGFEKIHVHLGDGIFENSHAGGWELLADSAYRVRVRFRDDQGEWSLWTERAFRTGSPGEIFPLKVQDIGETEGPRWTDGGANAVLLPPEGNPPAAFIVETAKDELLLEIRGLDGTENAVTNAEPLADHRAVRIRFTAAGLPGEFDLPETRLRFRNEDGKLHHVYLPRVRLAPGNEDLFWVSEDGSTYVATASQQTPDFSVLARGAPAPWVARQPGFEVEVFATGFQLPVNIAFVPDAGHAPDAPFFYVSELYGNVKVVTRDGTVNDFATGLLNFSPTGNFPGSGEMGVAGVVVDPATGDVLVSLVYQPDGKPEVHYPRVIRLRSDDGGRTASSQETILDMAGEPQGASHQISNLSIGPDGLLYVHLGDGGNPATALDLDSFQGKILRLRLDGSPAPDNPFHDTSDGINSRDYVYAYGLRNPFGGAWRASDGTLYEVENGPSVDRFAKVVRGRNFAYDGSDASMATHAIYNWSPPVAPVNIAFVQPETFGGSAFPRSKMGHAFVSESGPTWAPGPQFRGKRITVFELDSDGELLTGPTTLVEYNGSGRATAVALAAGPDGLYFSDLFKDGPISSPLERGAKILKVSFRGAPSFTTGLKGEYYAGLDFSVLEMIRTDGNVDFNWGKGSPDPLLEKDVFSVRWTGQLEVPRSGNYGFTTISDDGVRLWIRGKRVIDNWTDHAVTEDVGSISLEEGHRHEIRLEYYENGGDATIRWLWDGAGIATEAVPERYLSSPVLQSPFRDVPFQLPGLVEAEDFDRGGAAIAYHDADPENRGGQYRETGVDIEVCVDDGGGHNVGWIQAGEWLEYTVEVRTPGTHSLGVRVAARGPGGTIHVEVGGIDQTGPLSIPDTGGWQTWTTITAANIQLVSGGQLLRIVADEGGSNASAAVGNINFVRIERANVLPGDCNQDGALNLSDAICLLGHLFLSRPAALPCGDGSILDPVNRSLLDSDADSEVTLTDAVLVLRHLFLAGDPPHLGTSCVSLPRCPEACGR